VKAGIAGLSLVVGGYPRLSGTTTIELCALIKPAEIEHLPIAKIHLLLLLFCVIGIESDYMH
jgi:hypothetical protein